MTAEICSACGRFFTPNSKPRWAFTREGRPAGRVHAAPCIKGRNRTHLTIGYAGTQERAQFDVWLIYFHGWPDRDDVAAWEAYLLAEVPSETLSERQEKQLAHWAERAQDPRTPDQILAIREAHTALIREFIAWRAGLEQSAAPIYAGACS